MLALACVMTVRSHVGTSGDEPWSTYKADELHDIPWSSNFLLAAVIRREIRATFGITKLNSYVQQVSLQRMPIA